MVFLYFYTLIDNILGYAITFIPNSDFHKYLDMLNKVERSSTLDETVIEQNKITNLENWFDEALTLLKSNIQH